ncbi:MAG: response regulator [Clostridiales Family XIII bacterium]|jgi:putative two-component system response regulator|nr:response regulator [Clostridiales Family XIII bacterium]
MTEKNRKIIVSIDDDQIILNQIVDALSEQYSIRPFKSGEKAIKFIKNNRTDLILLDCNMPDGLSGFEVLERLQKDLEVSHIPVIFLTGSVDDDDEVRALDSGAIDFVIKPIKPVALQKRVAMQIELTEYRTRLENMVLQKTKELSDAYEKLLDREKVTLDLLAKAGDLRDHDTGEHIQRTADFSRIIANDLAQNPASGYEISQSAADDIAEATKLHDIGKIAMPDNVLLKPGKLTPEEFDIIKTHPAFGAGMLLEAVGRLGNDNLLKEAYDIAYSHHEKWNGSGYPLGLAGTEIPLSARIAAIADVFDALTSDRPYKKAFSIGDALDILYDGAGQHFDPNLIEVVKKHEKDFAQIRQQRS